jgi:phenylalanyl-tRNA synthetase beta chain
MKFTLSWLREHLDTDEPIEKLAEKLTMIGLEVESIEDKAKALGAFTIARVIEAKQHPNADRLRVCIVDTGAGEPVQVVCGAPNARTGMKGVFSPPGTYIPGKKITLGVGNIRGVESCGMLVSEAEMELSDDHEGIIDLPDDAPVGEPYAKWAGLDDPVIEINLTPNRPDCTGVHGIARDLAAADMGKFIDPAVKPVKTGRTGPPAQLASPEKLGWLQRIVRLFRRDVPTQHREAADALPCSVKVKIEAADLCPGFALRLVRGVKNGPSPDWLQKRLLAIGLRPINALVDITNFMTFDRGRPLHVFDAAKVHGNLTVRRGRKDESLLALDGRTYQLDETMCVIADEKGVESLSGIMGGEESGCDANTTDVLIESALWNPLNIAQTGRKLGINSDARYRFERGVDPNFMVPGLELATKMVLDLCGGEPSEMVVEGFKRADEKPIDFPLAEIKRLSGLDVPLPEARRVLDRLGFSVAGQGESVKVAIPSWRSDIEGKADIVEEVVRILGVDRVRFTPFPRGEDPRKPILTSLQVRNRKAKRSLAARGMVEAVTWSFIGHSQAELFGGGQAELVLANPIAADLSDMRPSLIPGLVASAQKNADRGFPDVALFEVGQVFKGDRPEDQLTAASGVRRALAKASGAGRHWTGNGEADAFDVKADALAVLVAAGAPPQAMQIVPGGPNWLHPGRSGTIQIGPQNVLGYFGELHPRALEALDAEGPLMAFEVILERIPEPKAKPTRAKPMLELSAFQPVTRDFAFMVERSVKAGDLVRAAQNVDRKLITNVTVFDLYEGPGVASDKKSIAIAVTLQPREKTMTDEEIDAVAAKIVAEVSRRTGGVLRG